MGRMAGLVPLRVGGAADGSSALFGVLTAEPGAKFACGRILTFGSEQVDKVGGLGMVGGQVCVCSMIGSSLVVSWLDLAV